jgi:mono/diheme cytochrome c family protein
MRFLTIILMIIFTMSYVFPVVAADAKAGKAKYDMMCVACHGATGLGDGAAAASLNPKPKKLAGIKRTDAQLTKIIKEGGAKNGLSATMPAWGGALTDTDIANVVAYIRTLK